MCVPEDMGYWRFYFEFSLSMIQVLICFMDCTLQENDIEYCEQIKVEE